MRMILVILALSLLAATGCQNTELNQCRDENAALQAKIADQQNTIKAQMEVIENLGKIGQEMSRKMQQLKNQQKAEPENNP